MHRLFFRKDPVNMAGFTAENIMNVLASFSGWDVERRHRMHLLDVREDAELMAFG